MQTIKINPTIKTISIEARPMWETKRNLQPYISKDSLDRQRIEKYQEAKEILDAYARKVIEDATQCVADEHIQPTYEKLEELFINAKDAKTRSAYRKFSGDFKKFVANIIKKVAGDYQLTKEFGKLFVEDKSAIYRNAARFGIEKEALGVLTLYNNFTSYFDKYFTSLSDVILCGVDHGSIAHRIMENMEYYWRNNQLLGELSEKHPELYVSIMDDIGKMNIEMCITQSGIDMYNLLLGNTKNTGINSIISMYAQKKHTRIKLLKQLNKIPLTEVDKQIVIDTIDNDEELQHVVLSNLSTVENILAFAKRCLAFHFDDETKESTYFINKNLNVLSHLMYGRYDLVLRILKEMELSSKEKEELIISVATKEQKGVVHMAGLDNNMLYLIKALAENRIQDAKKAAVACLVNDNTKKNEGKVQYYKKLLENGTVNMFELPPNLKGLLNMQDVSDFNENRYYLGKKQQELFSKIETGVEITSKLLAYGIPYMNSSIIYGEPGTGKTEFAKYVAYKLGIPYAYINFSYLLDSYMGKTAQNLQRIFDYCKGQKCVLMLDEIDCIGIVRSKDSGCDGEIGRTTIALMQALDELVNGQIIIAATNRLDRLDKALLRRFQYQINFVRYETDEEIEMITRYINSIDKEFMTDEIVEYAASSHTQAETVKFLVEKIIEQLK